MCRPRLSLQNLTRAGVKPRAPSELRPSASTMPEDIAAHCRKHLAGFKVPRAVAFRDLPKTSTGKIQKFELRQKAGSAMASDVSRGAPFSASRTLREASGYFCHPK
jgi:hypothetical protein